MSRTTRPRVLLLVPCNPNGGAQEILDNIADGLDEAHTPVLRLALYTRADRPGNMTPLGSWTALWDRKPEGLAEAARLVLRLMSEVRRYRPDVVLSAMPAGNLAAVFCGLIGFPRARVFISHHSPVNTHNPVLNSLDGVLAGLSIVKAVICVSESVRRSLRGKSSSYRGKSLVIHNALPPRIEDLCRSLSETVSFESRVSRILVAAGRLSRQKNYPVMIKAAACLPNVRVVIVGGGEDERDLRKLAEEAGVSERISFLGALSREDTLKVVASGSIFVQPSLFEGHSLALVEAASLGLPIIVSDVEVQREAVTDEHGCLCGILIDPNDPVALSKAVLKLLDDELTYQHWMSKSRSLGRKSSFTQVLARYRNLLEV